MPTRPRESFSSFVNARHSGPWLIEFCVNTKPQSWHIVSPWSKSSIRFRLPHSGQRWTFEPGLTGGWGSNYSILPLPRGVEHEGYSDGSVSERETCQAGESKSVSRQCAYKAFDKYIGKVRFRRQPYYPRSTPQPTVARWCSGLA